MNVVGCQPYAPAAFTPRINSILEAESIPGHMELPDATEKTAATPGIDPGTFRLVAQCLNHYGMQLYSLWLGLWLNDRVVSCDPIQAVHIVIAL
jgi:hypothetical protein